MESGSTHLPLLQSLLDFLCISWGSASLHPRLSSWRAFGAQEGYVLGRAGSPSRPVHGSHSPRAARRSAPTNNLPVIYVSLNTPLLATPTESKATPQLFLEHAFSAESEPQHSLWHTAFTPAYSRILIIPKTSKAGFTSRKANFAVTPNNLRTGGKHRRKPPAKASRTAFRGSSRTRSSIFFHA